MFYLYLKDKQLKQQINDAGEFMSTSTDTNEANIYTSALMLKCVFDLLSFHRAGELEKSPPPPPLQKNKTLVVDKWKLHSLRAENGRVYEGAKTNRAETPAAFACCWNRSNRYWHNLARPAFLPLTSLRARDGKCVV